MSGHVNDSQTGRQADPTRPYDKRIVRIAALIAVVVALVGVDVISADHASVPLTAVRAVSGRTAVPSASPQARTRQRVPGAAARLLAVASAVAYGPDGTSDGDHPGLAAGTINGGDGQAWHSAWYATPTFGNLQPGTGLLLDMGETVDLSRVRLVLGAPVGAGVQVRVGSNPDPADLVAVAAASDVGGTVQLRLATRQAARYVLIWFTCLPPKSPGEYQVSVYRAAVYGSKA